MNVNVGSSLYIGKVLNIPIKIHWSFGLLILFIAYILQGNKTSIEQSLWFYSIVAIMFVFVVMHEFGHALMAQRFGVQTRDIIISPIGGVARLESIPKKAKHELFVALAGPAVNVILALLFLLIQIIFRHPLFPQTDTIDLIASPSDYLGILLSINLALIVFNMIPAFPMDGGRVLRAILSILLDDHMRATQYASYIGQAFAIIFIIIGIYAEHYVLLFIGIFVFLTARTERKQAKQEMLMKNTRAFQVMRSEGFQINSFISVNSLHKEHSFLVVDDSGIIGCIPSIFLKNLDKNESRLAKDLISNSYGYVNENDTLHQIYETMNGLGWAISIVTDDNKNIKGVIDRPLLLSFSNRL